VLVIKSEHRSAIPGIVHGTSTSGASLFLEPLSTVEINNDIVALQEQELEEVRRILLALTDAFRSRALDLHRTIDAATELDVLQARARCSALVDGVEPQLSTDGTFELLEARHPLLMPQVIARLGGHPETRVPKPETGPVPVPVTIRITPPATVLLITGPNTGGKTVALKTAGLLAMMAQAGLHVPAATGSRVPVFRSLHVDIGDEQSIGANLSTFAAHITNIAAMDRSLVTPALVLLDEVGSGTDPIEGGALGVAIVDQFRQRGATVVATSHYDALKTYASTTGGVASAAFGFVADTFAPTYQLFYGSPGRSLALEMAARLGLNPSIVVAARCNLSARETQLAEHLAKIDHDMRAVEHEQRLATRERETLEAEASRMRQREDALRQREDLSRKRLDEALEAEVRQARQQIDEIITDLRAATSALARGTGKPAITTGDIGAIKSEARAAVDEAVRRSLQPAEAPVPETPAGRTVGIGDHVVMEGLGLEAVVTAIHDGQADLDVRGKRMRASASDLHRINAAPVAAPRVEVHVEIQARDGGASDLNVIGCTVDEALTRVERFLDQTLLSDQHTVRLIHGYGTGQLKRALAGFLQQHPLVARFGVAPPEQGGGGVTVVDLKD
jgi:DNA mismatch repair protein MutS2